MVTWLTQHKWANNVIYAYLRQREVRTCFSGERTCLSGERTCLIGERDISNGQ